MLMKTISTASIAAKTQVANLSAIRGLPILTSLLGWIAFPDALEQGAARVFGSPEEGYFQEPSVLLAASGLTGWWIRDRCSEKSAAERSGDGFVLFLDDAFRSIHKFVSGIYVIVPQSVY